MKKKENGFDKLIDSFRGIEEPRGGYSIKYPLIEILFLTVSSVVCGHFEWDEIVDFGEEKLDWLSKYLPFKNGIPSHDTVNRVIGMIDYRAFEESFVNWTTSGLKLPNGVVINIDGKKLRSSATKMEQQTAHSKGGKSAVHLVNAWCSEFQMCLAQYKTETKSNEIKAIPIILDWLEISNCIITIDAMGCQWEIAEKIKEKKADYILALKANQEKLEIAVKNAFKNTPIQKSGEDYYEKKETGHGRIETRQCRVIMIENIKNWETNKEWKGLKSIIEIESERTVVSLNQAQSEKRYYISSLENGAKELNDMIRGHWKIENQLHWTLDVQFKEDGSTKRARNTAQNFGLIRKFGLNILKGLAEKISMKRKMKKCALSDSYRENTLASIIGSNKKEDLSS